MKTIYKAGIAVVALLTASYVAFSAVVFFSHDSGNSNERWVAGPPSSEPAPAPRLGKGADLAAVYAAITANLEAGKFDRLIATATTAIEQHPKDGQLYYFRGFASLQKQLFDEAIRDFSAALDLAPTHADAYRFRAQAYMAKGQLDLAIADANTVCKLQPQNAESYVIRAMAYLTKGDVERAKPDVAKILQLDPNNAKGKVLSQQLQAPSKSAGTTPTSP